MIKTYDRKSRLSHFNPMRKPIEEDRDFTSPLAATPTNTSYGSNATEVWTDDNYKLVRMDTVTSIGSNFSVQSQYKVSLNLSKKDIELIRYTWNIMLLDEKVEFNKSSLPIPGGFPSQRQVSGKPANYINKTSSSTMASSLFCRQLYLNLLLMDPNLEKMFPSIKHQAVALSGVISFTISQLENLSNLDNYLINLGKRHSRILNIEPTHFEFMGEALIQTFHERFGVKFTQELETLWIKLYLYLSNSILQFGIDPVLKLNPNRKNSHHDYIFDNVSDQSAAPMSDFGDKRSSVSTAHSTYTQPRAAYTTEPMALPRETALAAKEKPKKKRDCVIV